MIRNAPRELAQHEPLGEIGLADASLFEGRIVAPEADEVAEVPRACKRIRDLPHGDPDATLDLCESLLEAPDGGSECNPRLCGERHQRLELRSQCGRLVGSASLCGEHRMVDEAAHVVALGLPLSTSGEAGRALAAVGEADGLASAERSLWGADLRAHVGEQHRHADAEHEVAPRPTGAEEQLASRAIPLAAVRALEDEPGSLGVNDAEAMLSLLERARQGIDGDIGCQENRFGHGSPPRAQEPHDIARDVGLVVLFLSLPGAVVAGIGVVGLVRRVGHLVVGDRVQLFEALGARCETRDQVFASALLAECEFEDASLTVGTLAPARGEQGTKRPARVVELGACSPGTVWVHAGPQPGQSTHHDVSAQRQKRLATW